MSHPKIAEAVDCLPGEMLFLSDIVDELIAADAAGFQTVQLVRPGTEVNWKITVKDFSEIELA
jgi:enolase-phosphatase E1